MVDLSGNIVEDTIPEDQSLFFDTENGIVLISGCGHAGLVNTLDYINKIIDLFVSENKLEGFKK